MCVNVFDFSHFRGPTFESSSRGGAPAGALLCWLSDLRGEANDGRSTTGLHASSVSVDGATANDKTPRQDVIAGTAIPSRIDRAEHSTTEGGGW